MAAPPRYAQRIGRLPRVLDALAAHPDGLPIGVLAAEFDVPPDELREDLLAFYTADPDPLLLGLSRPDVLEFLGPEGADADPATAEVVRVVDQRPTEELGVEHLDASQLALVYAAGRALLDVDPDDPHLRGALDALARTVFGEDAPATDQGDVGVLRLLQRAVEERRQVRVVYSRAWYAGVTERVVEPYRLVQTRRGWEVDAGLADGRGLRTFLLANLRTADLLDERFEQPDDLDRLLAAGRETTVVRVVVPHAARWAADFFSEHVELVEDGEDTSTLDLTLLPPVEQRVGLLTLAAGEETRVLSPSSLVASGPALAAELLAHHR